MDDQPPERTYGVSELAGLLGRLLAQAFPGPLWVQGQIRNLSRSNNGHVYFDLAEPGPLGSAPSALLPVTLLANDKPVVNAVLTNAGAGRMDDGVEVRIAARMSWYAPRGRLQLRMIGVDPTHTLGRLREDRDRLLALLRAEGLLVRNHAVALPVVPLHIGLVTSMGSAAHADFVHELERSRHGFRLTEIDARTQGLDAGWSIAAAITTAVRRGVEVVALVRGGGSATDLAPFDGEAIARAVASCSVPVFTGIGHEVDRSIADEVAHTSFKTPTACAGALVALVGDAMARAEDTWAAIARRAVAGIEQSDARTEQSSWRLARSTLSALAAADHGLDAARHRLSRDAVRALTVAEQRLHSDQVRLDALDPARALARGWSITRDAAGRVVRSAADVSRDDELVTTLADGAVTSTVTRTHQEIDHG